MYAIASLLDPESDAIVRRLWQRFEEHCGLLGIRNTPIPHFSWQGADRYQFEQVETVLQTLSQEIQPFTVNVSGIGIFTGLQPVIYLALIKDSTLLNIHRQIWERVLPYAVKPNLYYDPRSWVPHITLAFKEVDQDRLGCAVADIANQHVNLQILVDHFALIYQAGGDSGLHSRFGFQASMNSIGDGF